MPFPNLQWLGWHCAVSYQALMTFFNKVIANESKNRMSIWNISTIMAPNLFFSRSKHSDCEELLLANTAAHIIRLMLKYQEMLWKVSDNVTTRMFSCLLAPRRCKDPWASTALRHRERWETVIPGCWWHLYHSLRLLLNTFSFKQESS